MMDYIRAWKERIVGDMRTYAVDAAKNAEIDELRAALDANTRQIATLHATIAELETMLAAVGAGRAMTAQPPLVIPRLIAPRTGGNPIPERLIAAVRYDYEIGLLSMAQCVERYSTLLGAQRVREICAGQIHPDVKASRLKLLWR